MDAKNIIDNLQLIRHPEGGYYRETYRSAELLHRNESEKRNLCTSIYYLLEKNDRSRFHRIRSDELWFFHQGQPLEILLIQNKELISVILGNDILRGEQPFFIVSANTWFAARIRTAIDYSLVSCTVSPGFDFADFELAGRDDLFRDFPNLKEVIVEFT